MPAEERERVQRLIAEVYAGRTATVRAHRLRADGTRFPAQISMAPLKLLDGSWHGTLAMIRDITDLVQAESELRDRAALLERSNADLERFAYAASHDLQEPLNSIRLSAGAVIEAARERLDADERELMEHIDAAASRLSGQVRGLMEVAQVAIGRNAGERLPLAVALDDVIDSLRAAASSAQAAIEVRRPVPEIQVPRTELAAALQNVIANAIKYHRPGVPPRIMISAETGESLLEIRVADNGRGLTEQDLDRVFGLFERGASDLPGTGMGLAVARRMLERLGGSMLAASEGPGRGCEFTAAGAAQRLTASSADGLGGGLEARGLAEVAVGAGGQRGLLGVLVGEHEDRAAGPVRAQLARDLEAVELGHREVEHDDVRRQLARERQRLGAVGRLADELEVRVRGDRAPQQPADQLVVVGQQDAGGGGGGRHVSGEYLLIGDPRARPPGHDRARNVRLRAALRSRRTGRRAGERRPCGAAPRGTGSTRRALGGRGALRRSGRLAAGERGAAGSGRRARAARPHGRARGRAARRRRRGARCRR